MSLAGAGRAAPSAVFGVLMMVVAVGAGCARPQAPEGGPVPELPLQVVESTPAHLSTVEPFDDPVTIRLERTLIERPTTGAPEAAVVVSPQTGDVAVDTDGPTVRISMEGGFRETTVYRITLLPRFQDRYQNTMARPYDLVFSTGPELEPNLLAGLVTDRLTLEAVEDVRVDAVDAQGIAHSTVTDTAGVFALPYLPSGAYRVGAYEDRDRDRTAAFAEAQDSIAVTVNPGDTLLITDLELLAPDTTAAVLQDVVVIDSMTLRAELDDPIDPNTSLDPVQATIQAVGGGATVPVAEILHAWEWEERQAEAQRAAAQQAAAAAGAANAPVADPAAPGAPDPAGAGAQDPQGVVEPDVAQEDQSPPLPAREIILVLGLEMGVGTPWEITVSGVPNINGIPDGGGTVEMVREPPPSTQEPDPDDPTDTNDPADTDDAPGPDDPPDPDAR